MLLAPTVNIHRSVTNGRNFECYSEDPILTAELAVAYIQGLQGQGIAATHQAFRRQRVRDRAHHDELARSTSGRCAKSICIPFEAAVKKAGTWGVMSLLQPPQRHLHLRAPLAADRGAARRMGLRRRGHVGLVRHAFDRTRPSMPGSISKCPGPPRDRGAEAGRRGRGGRGERSHPAPARSSHMLRLMRAGRRARRPCDLPGSAPTTGPSTAR